MGNEASSMRIHSALTAEDIKGLRNGFPGGGNGPAPTDLNFGMWGKCWPKEERKQLESLLRKEQIISFHAYQELAGMAVRGTTEDRVKLLFRLLDTSPEKTIKLAELLQFVTTIVETVAKLISLSSDSSQLMTMSSDTQTQELKVNGQCLAESLMHELVFPGEPSKNCLLKDIPLDHYLDFDMIERWLVMKCRLFEQLYLYSLAASFGIPTGTSITGVSSQSLIPLEGPRFGLNTSLTPDQLIFLNNELGSEFKTKWRPVFNSTIHGESFAKFSSAVQNIGPNLIVVWETNGYVFGGFASDSWKLGPKFYGSNSCFLFSLSPKMYVYETARFNTNYMYFNLKQKTMPNGLGMGGQLDYFGFWLDAEYGNGKCSPSCTSYQSPQLSKDQNFKFSHIEVWGLGDEPLSNDDGQGSRSALDLDPEAQAVMEMMGKTFVSKAVKAEDEQMAKEQQQQQQ